MALSPQQYLFVDALEQGMNLTDAASYANVSYTTGKVWWKDHEVRGEFDHRRMIARDLSTARLQTVALVAVEALVRLLEAADPNVRARAADAILKHKFKATEQDDLLRRLVEALKKHDLGGSPPEAAGGPPP